MSRSGKRKNEVPATSASEIETEDASLSDTTEETSGAKPKKTRKEKETTTTDLMNFLETMKSEMKANFQEAKQQFESMSGSVKALDERLSIVESKIATNSNQPSLKYNHELELLQIESRKLNLIFVGLQDNSDETEESLINKIVNFCSNEVEVRNVQIDLAHRLAYNQFGPRNIKVRFLSLRQRNQVFNSRNILRTKKIPVFINEDLPPVTANRRKLLRKECSKAKDLGHKTRLLGDRLWIDDLPYEIDDKNDLIRVKPNHNKMYRSQTNSAFGSQSHHGENINTRNHAGIQDAESPNPLQVTFAPGPFQQNSRILRTPPQNC